MNCAQLYRALADKYNWTPQQVGKLTLLQMRTYLEAEDAFDGRATYADIEAAAQKARGEVTDGV